MKISHFNITSAFTTSFLIISKFLIVDEICVSEQVIRFAHHSLQQRENVTIKTISQICQLSKCFPGGSQTVADAEKCFE